MVGSMFAMNPLLALRAQIDPNSPPLGGGVPPSPPAPAATPAPPPVAPTAPDAAQVGGGGAGGQGVMQGIGSAINRAMSGEGVFGTPLDGAPDPNTGMSPEQSRRMNMQSIMKMGMMLMAAGGRQSDESRSRIMAQLPSALDNSDQINSFARNRLEMAKVKLLEKEAARDTAMGAALDARYGTGGSPGATVPAGTPVAAPGGVTGGVPAVGGAPGVPGAPGAPGAVLAGGAGGDQILAAKPPAPPIPQYTPTPDERVAIGAMPPKEKLEYVKQRTAQVANGEVATPRYYDENGNVVQDIYKNGALVETKKVADAPRSVQDRSIGNGITERSTIQGGRVVEKTNVNDPVVQARTKADEDFIRDSVKERQKTYREAIMPAQKTYERATELEKKVRSGEGIFGTGAGIQTGVLNAAASMGYLSKERIQDLITSNNVEQLTGQAAGEFAKAFYGPNVSVADVDNANRLMGALRSNSADQVADALMQIRRHKREQIQGYNSEADEHNERAKMFEMGDRWSLKKVDKNFDKDDEEIAPLRQRPLGSQNATPAPAPVTGNTAPPAAAVPAQSRTAAPVNLPPIPKNLPPEDAELWRFYTPEERQMFIQRYGR